MAAKKKADEDKRDAKNSGEHRFGSPRPAPKPVGKKKK